MEFVLEIRPPEGEMYYIPLPQTGVLTIGREAPADIVVRDRFLSRSHFQLQCADMMHTLMDAGSSNGTFVNGVRLNQIQLKPRDAIYAGRTAFRYAPRLNGKVVLDNLPESPGELPPWQQKLIAALEAACKFVVLDGAIGPVVRDLLNQSGVFYQSLYEGDPGGDLAKVGPYLAEIQKGGKLLPFLIKSGWGKSWGVFLSTKMEFVDMRKHLRRFLTVELEPGRKVIFRFYDPRVMKVFIPSCDGDQREKFFGNIQHIFVESDTPKAVTRFGVASIDQYQLE